MCIAVLNDNLSSISIKFRPQPTIAAGVESNGQAGLSGAMDGSRSPKHHESRSSSPLDKQCSLTLLVPMSSARCGLGTAVLGGRLIALGKCNLTSRPWEVVIGNLQWNGRGNGYLKFVNLVVRYLLTKLRIWILISVCIQKQFYIIGRISCRWPAERYWLNELYCP